MIREELNESEREAEWAGSLQEQTGTRRRRLNDAHTAVWAGRKGERERSEL